MIDKKTQLSILEKAVKDLRDELREERNNEMTEDYRKRGLLPDGFFIRANAGIGGDYIITDAKPGEAFSSDTTIQIHCRGTFELAANLRSLRLLQEKHLTASAAEVLKSIK